MQVTTRWAGPAATDGRSSVTLREDETPWSITFYFLQVMDDESGEVSNVNVGLEIGDAYPVEPGTGRVSDPVPVDVATVQRIAANYSSYLEIARHALVLDRGGVAALAKMLHGRSRKPARLTPDFYRAIAADYNARRRGGEPYLVKAISEAYHVDISTASRWITRARTDGYITDEGGDAK